MVQNNREIIQKLTESISLCQSIRLRQIEYAKSFGRKKEKRALEEVKEIFNRRKELCNHPIAIKGIDSDWTCCLSCHKELNDDETEVPTIYAPGLYMAIDVSNEIIKLLQSNPSLSITDIVSLIQKSINKTNNFEYDKAEKRTRIRKNKKGE